MRIFIALNIPEKTKNNIERSSSQFAEKATKGNFVKKENYHITLHFLGNVMQSDLIYVQSAMDSIKDMPSPRLSISQFASLRASNVICAKFNKDDRLTALHDALGEKLEETGFTVEHRAYRPHVTIIRNYGSELPFSEVTKCVDVYNMPFDTPEVVLYESILSDKGATYNPLYTVKLRIDD